MPTLKPPDRLPARFEDLAEVLQPQAIMDEAQYQASIEMIDRLMAAGKLTKGQSLYLETLVQLVQSYESSHFAVETSGLSGLDSLKHLLAENHMSASDLARLLDLHASMGSKILSGERALTVPHLKKLAVRFKVRPSVFLD